MHAQAREPRQGRKAATVTTSCQCRGLPGHFLLFWIFDWRFWIGGWFQPFAGPAGPIEHQARLSVFLTSDF